MYQVIALLQLITRTFMPRAPYASKETNLVALENVAKTSIHSLQYM